MSRVAKKLINLPKGVELKDADGVLSVKGPKGTLNINKPNGVSVSNEGFKLLMPSSTLAGSNWRTIVIETPL